MFSTVSKNLTLLLLCVGIITISSCKNNKLQPEKENVLADISGTYRVIVSYQTYGMRPHIVNDSIVGYENFSEDTIYGITHIKVDTGSGVVHFHDDSITGSGINVTYSVSENSVSGNRHTGNNIMSVYYAVLTDTFSATNEFISPGGGRTTKWRGRKVH